MRVANKVLVWVGEAGVAEVQQFPLVTSPYRWIRFRDVVRSSCGHLRSCRLCFAQLSCAAKLLHGRWWYAGGINHGQLLHTRNTAFLQEITFLRVKTDSSEIWLKSFSRILLTPWCKGHLKGPGPLWSWSPFQRTTELETHLNFSLGVAVLSWTDIKVNWQSGCAFVCSALTCGSLRETAWPCSAGS